MRTRLLPDRLQELRGTGNGNQRLIHNMSKRSRNSRRQFYALEVLEGRLLLSGLTWATGPSMPTALGRTVAVNTGYGILVAGGATTAAATSAPTSAHFLDYWNDVWTSAPSIDRGRNGAAIGETGSNGPVVSGSYKYSGDIFIYGGSTQSQPTASAVNYDPSPGGEGTTNAPSMSVARYDFAAATDPTTGDLYAFGGLTSSNQTLSSVERYDPSLDAWVTVAALPKALSKASAASDGAGHILVFGGNDSTGALSSAVYSYTILTNTWTTMASMPVATGSSAALFGNYGQIYVIGGQTSSGPTSAVWIFNPVTNEWTADTPLPTAEYGASVVMDYNNNLDVIGGFNSAGNAVGTVYTAAALPAPTDLPVLPTLQINADWFIYDGTAHALDATVVGSDGVTQVDGQLDVTYNGSVTPPTAAGTYNILATFTSADSGYVNTIFQDQFTIAQATPTLSVTGGGTITFDGQPHGITATALGVDGATPVNGTYSYTYNGSATVPVNPGTYAAVVTFTSLDPNYANTSATATITIPDPTIPTGVVGAGASTTSIRISWNPVAGAASYDIWERFVAHSPRGSGVSISYGVIANTTSTSIVLNRTGTFYVSSVSPAGAVSPRSVGVSPQTLSAPSLNFFLWNGADMSSAYVEVGQTLTVTLYAYGNEAPTYTMVSGPSTMSLNPITGAVTYTPAPSEAGYTSATFTATNSVGSSTATFQFHILALPTVVVTGGTFAYDGNTHSATSIAYGTDGVTPIAGTFNYLYAPTAYPTSWSTSPYAEPGNYLVQATFTSSDPNYGGATGTGTLTILADAWSLAPNVLVPTSTATLWTGGNIMNYVYLQSGGEFILQSPDTVEIRSLNLEPESLVDLNAHFLILHSNSLSEITADIANGLITSSTASASSGLMGLGVIDGATYLALNGPNATFGGLPVLPTDVLVRLTAPGDTNLDGVVDLRDYRLMDAGYVMGGMLSGYSWGDVNYDGVVDATDYAMADHSLSAEGSQLAASMIAMHTASLGEAYTQALTLLTAPTVPTNPTPPVQPTPDPAPNPAPEPATIDPTPTVFPVLASPEISARTTFAIASQSASEPVNQFALLTDALLRAESVFWTADWVSPAITTAVDSAASPLATIQTLDSPSAFSTPAPFGSDNFTTGPALRATMPNQFTGIFSASTTSLNQPDTKPQVQVQVQVPASSTDLLGAIRNAAFNDPQIQLYQAPFSPDTTPASAIPATAALWPLGSDANQWHVAICLTACTAWILGSAYQRKRNSASIQLNADPLV